LWAMVPDEDADADAEGNKTGVRKGDEWLGGRRVSVKRPRWLLVDDAARRGAGVGLEPDEVVGAEGSSGDQSRWSVLG
jgi:hypothetical protein